MVFGKGCDQNRLLWQRLVDFDNDAIWGWAIELRVVVNKWESKRRGDSWLPRPSRYGLGSQTVVTCTGAGA